MEKRLSWLAVGAAFIGLAMTLPSCPGQKAMQKQIDGLATHQHQIDQRIQGADTQVKNVAADLTQVKNLVNQLSQTVLAQKDAIEKLNATLQGQAEALAKLSKPTPARRRTTRRKARSRR